MCFVRAIVGEPYGIALALFLILLVRTDITAGLAVRTLNDSLTEIVIAARGQKEELAAMLTTLWDKSLAKPTKEIKVCSVMKLTLLNKRNRITKAVNRFFCPPLSCVLSICSLQKVIKRLRRHSVGTFEGVDVDVRRCNISVPEP